MYSATTGALFGVPIAVVLLRRLTQAAQEDAERQASADLVEIQLDSLAKCVNRAGKAELLDDEEEVPWVARIRSLYAMRDQYRSDPENGRSRLEAEFGALIGRLPAVAATFQEWRLAAEHWRDLRAGEQYRLHLGMSISQRGVAAKLDDAFTRVLAFESTMQASSVLLYGQQQSSFLLRLPISEGHMTLDDVPVELIRYVEAAYRVAQMASTIPIAGWLPPSPFFRPLVRRVRR